MSANATLTKTALRIVSRLPEGAQRGIARKLGKNPALSQMPAAQAAVLALMAAGKQPDVSDQPIAAARAGYQLFADALDNGRPKGIGLSRTHLPGPAGDMACLTFHPGRTPKGIILYLHGGGWNIGSPGTHQPLCRMMAKETGCKVISVDYRLAPEAPFPAAADDCWAAYRAVREQAGTLPVFLSGDSAGGNLAAVVTCRTIQRKSKKPDGLALFYPGTDLTTTRDSIKEFGEGYFLTEKAMTFFRDSYVPDEGQRSEVDASPLLFEHLERFPPTWVGTAGFDPLQDDGKAFAGALEKAGVSLKHHHATRLIHGYVHMLSCVEEARDAVDDACDFLEGLIYDD